MSENKKRTQVIGIQFGKNWPSSKVGPSFKMANRILCINTDAQGSPNA